MVAVAEPTEALLVRLVLVVAAQVRERQTVLLVQPTLVAVAAVVALAMVGRTALVAQAVLE